MAQDDNDSPPTYTTKSAFLYWFTTAEINLIVPAAHTMAIPEIDGGGTEIITDTVWLPSPEEIGAKSVTENDPVKFDYFSSNSTRAWDYGYFLRTSYSNNRVYFAYVGGNVGSTTRLMVITPERVWQSRSLRSSNTVPMKKYIA